MLNKINAQKLLLASLITLAIFPAVILLARTGAMHFRNSFLIMIIAAIVAFIVLVLAVFKMSRAKEGESKSLILTMLCTATPLVILGNFIALGQSRPFIHDITTDFDTPPELVAAADLRTPDENPVTYIGGEVMELQMQGYPDLKPLLLNVNPDEAFAMVEKQVQVEGWELVAKHKETLPYTVEAVATSLLFGFKDDIAIRISRTESGTRIDMRSKSRVGKSDLGANADRIKNFFEALSK
ncbi:DUF1499 domain-containing protein [Bermanella marisrubri]|uniref:DUF1499 domain-containing protein n=1 Tax=Bermanella marisrubri TaxID=207949 RepID=Q1MYV4_9GAMM|nr:DUF1499 domain-containing protein [Bermanella marisrubri]EAT11187.1 hypothetical protein RED65_07879 [Oceanobacter sp. RED65] [Bermanella marisrubri]QIZ83364.1 DUF1499 domain-containing protein [Bermanella marisrubri]